MDDLVKRLRSVPPCNGCGEYPGVDIAQIMETAAARIEALEARVAAADKLAQKAKAQHDKFLTWSHKPDAKKALKSLDADADFLDALAAYEATKEQSDA